MTNILENLRRFNRKERFHLVCEALGVAEFQLADGFRKKVGEKFGLSIPVNAFVAMDYHLDWIYASLLLSSPKADEALIVKTPQVYKGSDNITANQEDVDLLIAFPIDKDTGIVHLIFLEAKLDTSWTNDQIESKARRLEKIFGPKTGEIWPEVKPHFAILSPKEPEKLKIEMYPEWMRANGSLVWIEFSKPINIQKITRCSEKGISDAKGNCWKVEER